VGRFENFVRAYSSIDLKEGDGKAPHIRADEGWKESYLLPATSEELELAVTCTRTTWTADYAVLPMNCVNWYIAYAFCIWDDGRLPTEAEWNRAAAGGDDQRVYPWSVPSDSTVIRPEHAVYDLTDALPPPVGSKQPTGQGKWGHADLAGSLWEWTLDFYNEPYKSTECNDCLATSGLDFERSIRGGSFDHTEEYAYASSRAARTESTEWYTVGFRCAHDVNLSAIPQSAASNASR
jgi:formylglycine-generating enzyme required for sulfatase activity